MMSMDKVAVGRVIITISSDRHGPPGLLAASDLAQTILFRCYQIICVRYLDHTARNNCLCISGTAEQVGDVDIGC